MVSISFKYLNKYLLLMGNDVIGASVGGTSDSPFNSKDPPASPEMENGRIIEILDVTKYFGDVKAVDGISLHIQKGELFGLLGPNGAGKSTLMRMLTTILTPSTGTAKVLDYSIRSERSKIVKHIGVCPQENVLFDSLTAEENVNLVARLYGFQKEEARARAGKILEKLGIAGKKRWSKKFSGGMKRRLNLAMCLVHDPDIIFLDEPTAGLDPQARRLVWELIGDLKRRNKTIVLTTHDMIEADALSDRIAIIDAGKIIAEGTPKELKEHFGGNNILEITVLEKGDLIFVNEQVKDLGFITKFIEDESNNKITLHFPGGMQNYLEILKSITTRIKDVKDLYFRQTTLEDVFLGLTGRGLRDS
ncbi:MAG: ABC transporter ATP-binding protein [Promethearchaeota archaeon]